MRWSLLTVLTLALLTAQTAIAQTNTLNVPGTANLFGAGHTTPPGPGGGGAGVLPPGYNFGFTAAPGTLVTFTSVTGTVTLNNGTGTTPNNPDGIGSATTNLDVNSFGGISGIRNGHAGFLTGVFLGAAEPADPAPARLQFSDAGGGGAVATSFASLSPTLNQTFFIGDGLTGNGAGSAQQFFVPAGATRMFLGITDASSYVGDPGAYVDNSGNFTATFVVTPVPEPSCLALLGMGVLCSAWSAKRLGRRPSHFVAPQ